MITELLPAIEDPEILGIHIEKSIHPTLHLTIIIASSLDTVSMRIGIGYGEERIYGIDPSHYIAVPRGLIERDLHQEAVLVEPLHALCHG